MPSKNMKNKLRNKKINNDKIINNNMNNNDNDIFMKLIEEQWKTNMFNLCKNAFNLVLIVINSTLR